MGVQIMKKQVLLLVIALVFTSLLSGCAKVRDYKEAMALFEEEEYEEAASIFAELGDYKDSGERLELCEELIEKGKRYEEAKALLDEEKYEEAYPIFLELRDFDDSEEQAKNCIVEEAKLTALAWVALAFFGGELEFDKTLFETEGLRCSGKLDDNYFHITGKSRYKESRYTYEAPFSFYYTYNSEEGRFNVDLENEFNINTKEMVAVDSNGNTLDVSKLVRGKTYNHYDSKGNKVATISFGDGVLTQKIYTERGYLISSSSGEYSMVKELLAYYIIIESSTNSNVTRCFYSEDHDAFIFGDDTYFNF